MTIWHLWGNNNFAGDGTPPVWAEDYVIHAANNGLLWKKKPVAECCEGPVGETGLNRVCANHNRGNGRQKVPKRL